MKSLLILLLLLPLAGNGEDLRKAAIEALRKGTEFYRAQVAVECSYLWQYSEDLSIREGEGRATKLQGWVQPPGTPAVGMAYLQAWEATRGNYFLSAAKETGGGLLQGQLQSGGWHYAIEFDPAKRKKIAYRIKGGKGTRLKNVTTLDDDTTQAALRFLMRLDKALEFKNTQVHEAVEFGLNALLRAQYPNGAWPQGYDVFPDPEKFPVKKASYPQEWPREWPGSKQYWLRYTLNDNLLSRTVETFLEAAATYKEGAAKYRKAAEKAGDFLIMAQMPEPQPAWAQQYDFEMQPSWARKFEPPAVTGGESQEAIKTLMALYRATGEKRFLEPIPRTLKYLKSRGLPDGKLARFYELKTNRPLYFTRDYKLTYDDGNVPTHYSFKVSDRTDKIAKEFASIGRRTQDEINKPPDKLVREIIDGMDGRGAWVENGKIRSATFNRNLEVLSDYIKATRNEEPR